MAERPLDADEAALWARVLETVRPAPGRALPRQVAAGDRKPERARQPRAAAAVPHLLATPKPGPALATTLDRSWDRRLAAGSVTPDRIVDLHGDTLDRAYGRIDGALAEAVAGGERVVLLITGKPGGARSGGRGAIRALVGDWLAASRHAGRIAAVRAAHPRHGGGGALYVVLRRAGAAR